MNNPTITMSITSEGLSTDTDAISLPVSLFPPSLPSIKEVINIEEQRNKKRVLDNLYKQSQIYYSFNSFKDVA